MRHLLQYTATHLDLIYQHPCHHLLTRIYMRFEPDLFMSGNSNDFTPEKEKNDMNSSQRDVMLFPRTLLQLRYPT